MATLSFGQVSMAFGTQSEFQLLLVFATCSRIHAKQSSHLESTMVCLREWRLPRAMTVCTCWVVRCVWPAGSNGF